MTLENKWIFFLKYRILSAFKINPKNIWKNPMMTAIFILKLLMKARSFLDWFNKYMVPYGIDSEGWCAVFRIGVLKRITGIIQKKRDPREVIITNYFKYINPL